MASDSSSVSACMRTTASPSCADFHAPIDAQFAAGGHFDLLRQRRVIGVQALAVEFQAPRFTCLADLQIVVHVGREHHFVLLDEEPRRLQPDDQILARDDFGSPSPTRVPCPMPQTRIFQVVRFSGMSSDTCAVPSSLVSSEPTHRAVSANLVRTVGCTKGTVPAAPPSADLDVRRSVHLTPPSAAAAAMTPSAIAALPRSSRPAARPPPCSFFIRLDLV